MKTPLYRALPLILFSVFATGCSPQQAEDGDAAKSATVAPAEKTVVEQLPPTNLPPEERTFLDQERRHREQALAENKRDGRR
jgi:hypothetical protein